MKKLVVRNLGGEVEEFEFDGGLISLAPGEAVEIGDAPAPGQVMREVAAVAKDDRIAAVPGTQHVGGFL